MKSKEIWVWKTASNCWHSSWTAMTMVCFSQVLMLMPLKKLTATLWQLIAYGKKWNNSIIAPCLAPGISVWVFLLILACLWFNWWNESWKRLLWKWYANLYQKIDQWRAMALHQSQLRCAQSMQNPAIVVNLKWPCAMIGCGHCLKTNCYWGGTCLLVCAMSL